MRPAAGVWRWTLAVVILVFVIVERGAPTTALAAIQQDDLAVIGRQHDFGGVAILTRLIGPFSGLDLALDVEVRALVDVLLDDLGEPLIKHHNVVPFTVLRRAHFKVFADMADQ